MDRRIIKELEKGAGKRKEAEEELRKYQFIIESAHDAIFFKDLESRYIIANDKTLGAFGLSREDVIGKNDYELMPDQKEAKRNVHSVIHDYRKHKTPLSEKWGSTSSHMALPLFKVEATIFESKS